MAAETNPAKTPKIERSKDFVSLYANHVQVEQNAFDLKLLLGELDQSQGTVRVEQHSSVTFSWMQAKLLAYYLQLNIATYEFQNGKIQIRKDLMPVEIPQLLPRQQKDPKIRELWDLIKSLRNQFVSNI